MCKVAEPFPALFYRGRQARAGFAVAQHIQPGSRACEAMYLITTGRIREKRIEVKPWGPFVKLLLGLHQRPLPHPSEPVLARTCRLNLPL